LIVKGGYFTQGTKQKYSAEYISYVERGDSAAVFIVRDIVVEIETSNMWVDVVDLSASKKNNQFEFNYIIVEIFKRKIKPLYPEKDEFNGFDYTETCKYITWETANRDIQEQKSKKFIGPKYLILCSLINKNKGKWIIEDAVWNKKFQRWVNKDWIMTSECVVKKKKIFVPPEKNDWSYQIDAVRKLRISDVERIKTNKEDILKKIELSSKPKIDFFDL
jgi:hypothetical protein